MTSKPYSIGRWGKVVVTLVTWTVLTFVNMGETRDCFGWTIYQLNALAIDCSNMDMDNIPKNLAHNVQNLMLANNRISVLKADEFLPYKSLQHINLDSNVIYDISAHAFRDLNNLQTLHLESNNLSYIPQASFQYLASLKELNLRGNRIRRVEADAFVYLTSLDTLNLENNYIAYIAARAFAAPRLLRQINLVSNELRTLSSDMQPHLPPLSLFRLYRNPWHCDCHLRWLRHWIANNNVEWNFATTMPQCESPALIQGVHWKALDPPRFACAARIESNASTTIQVVLGANITIACDAYGDPEPNITWKKGAHVLHVDSRIQRHVIKDHVRSTLTISSISEQDTTDYKCIAQNYAGISEVSYKLWAEAVAVPSPGWNLMQLLTREILLGIVIGGSALFLILLITCITCICRQSNSRGQAYNVREYQSPNGHKKTSQKTPNNVSGNSHRKSDGAHEQAATPRGNKERRELLAEDRQSGNPPKHPPTTDIDGRGEVENNFQMKIFTSQDSAKDAEIGRDLEYGAAQVGQGRAPRVAQATAQHTSRDTPDLLKESSTLSSNARLIPVPPPVIPSYVTSHYPRAEENPYVKPSELRATQPPMRRKTASADDLLDSAQRSDSDAAPCEMTRSTRSRDDLEYVSSVVRQQTGNDYPGYATVCRKKDTRGKGHPKTCRNPVCLQDPNLGLETQGNNPPPRKSNLKQSTPREGDLGRVTSPQQSPPCTYSTLQQRETYHSPTSYSHEPTYSTINPAGKRARGGHAKTVSFSEHGHPIIDLTHEMPAPIVLNTDRSSRAAPHATRGGSGGYQLPASSRTGPANISGIVPSPPHGKVAVASSVGYQCPLPNGSPAKTHSSSHHRSASHCTTLDELLSPPFGHVSSPRATLKLHGDRTAPKPGEKDEFGTAV